jgi:hypothetical protein
MNVILLKGTTIPASRANVTVTAEKLVLGGHELQ